MNTHPHPDQPLRSRHGASRNCVLARALGVPIYPQDEGDGLEMQFPDAQLARRIGVIMYLPLAR